jgi:hypothetical protein
MADAAAGAAALAAWLVVRKSAAPKNTPAATNRGPIPLSVAAERNLMR